MENMNDITFTSINLPETLPELAKFALIGREKLSAVRAEIRAIDKVGLAQEVRQQKLEEAQAISEAVLDAEVKIGELMREVPKASGGDRRSEDFKNNTADTFEKTKTEVIADAGFTPMQVSRFETLAAHPDIVEEAKAEARQNEEVLSRSAVLKKIEEAKKPHVSFNSGNNEWYTPPLIIEAARIAMGGIDLDPASSDLANEVVQAETYYTAETDGLSHEWHGNVWLNPPYSTDMIGSFIDKLIYERERINQAIVLVNNATETEWFSRLISQASVVCFPKGRVKFYMPDGKAGAPLQGQAVVYIGEDDESFIEAFSGIGWRCWVVGV